MEDGVKCVEDLKYLKKKEWDDLFASESKFTRRHSAHVYEEYLKGDPDPKQCASELNAAIKTASPTKLKNASQMLKAIRIQAVTSAILLCLSPQIQTKISPTYT